MGSFKRKVQEDLSDFKDGEAQKIAIFFSGLFIGLIINFLTLPKNPNEDEVKLAILIFILAFIPSYLFWTWLFADYHEEEEIS